MKRERENMGFDGRTDVEKERKASQDRIRVPAARTRLVILSAVAPCQDSSPRYHPRATILTTLRTEYGSPRDTLTSPDYVSGIQNHRAVGIFTEKSAR